MTPTPATPTSANPSKNDLRSAKIDGVQIDITGDKTRDKCVELIYDALASDSGAREFHLYAAVYAIYHDATSARPDLKTGQGYRIERALTLRNYEPGVQGQDQVSVRQLEG
jgi:hypothetical protein